MAVKIVPVSEVRQKLKDILAGLEATGEPYFITQYSRPKAVILRYEDYNTMVEQAARGHPRIVHRPDISGGEPIIEGTRVSVRHLVERVQGGQSIEDIRAALPHLSSAQVHDALSYYYDHKSEVDQLIKESQLEKVVGAQGLRAEGVADGVAVIRDESGRW